MTTKQHLHTIIPLDLNSIIGLMESNVGEFAPLNYKVFQPSPDTTEIHVNIQPCDMDSIAINVSPNDITISGNASFQFQEPLRGHGIQLNGCVETKIPLSPGVDIHAIRSQITDDALILTIPLI